MSAASLRALVAQFERGGASHVLQTYLSLHENKIGAHWLWIAICAIVAGEPEKNVLADYGYRMAEWIACPGRLPEPLTDVLIAMRTEDGGAVVDTGFLARAGGWYLTDSVPLPAANVTYWQPIPPPPR